MENKAQLIKATYECLEKYKQVFKNLADYDKGLYDIKKADDKLEWVCYNNRKSFAESPLYTKGFLL